MIMGPQNRRDAQVFAREELRADIQYEILKCLGDQGVSQSDLARRLGCSPALVSQFLDDDANLTLDSIAKVFLALGRRCVVATEPSEYAFGHEDIFAEASQALEDDWDSVTQRVLGPRDGASMAKTIKALKKASLEHGFSLVSSFEATNDNYVEPKVKDNYAEAKLNAA